MRKSNYLFPALAIGLTAVSCQDYDAGFTEADFVKKEYSDTFKQLFGDVDPNQNWSMAQQVTAHVSGVEDGILEIYYSDPIGGQPVMLTQQKISGGEATVKFDVVKGTKTIFARINDGTGYYSMKSHFQIVDGEVNISPSTTRAVPTGTSRVTKSEVYSLTSSQVLDNSKTYELMSIPAGNTMPNPDWYIDGCYGYMNGVTPRYLLKTLDYYKDGEFTNIYKLYDVISAEDERPEWYVKDIAHYFISVDGEPAVFDEGTNHVKLMKPGSVPHLEKDLVFEMEENGPFYLDYFAKGTQYNNQFGYFYFTGENPTVAEFMSMPKFVLVDNMSTKGGNVTINSTTTQGWNLLQMKSPIAGSNLADYSVDYTEAGNQNCHWDTKVVGTRLQLTFFGPNGTDATGSYTFPKGTKIGLFIIGNTEMGRDNEFITSIAQLNLDMYNEYPHAASFIYNDEVVFAMEDQRLEGDADVNDVMFIANGKFKKTDIPVINPVIPQFQTWVVACEDLGGTFDYDFNDVVFGLRKEDKAEGPSDLYLVPLAAGGTLKAEIIYNETNLGEIHDLVHKGAAYTSPLNVGAGSNPGAGAAIKLGTVDKNTSIPDCAKMINIKVTKENDTVDDNNKAYNVGYKKNTETEDFGSAPQAIILPAGWDWPSEMEFIGNVYPGITSWVADQEVTTWCNSKKNGADGFVHNPLPAVPVPSEPSQGEDTPTTPETPTVDPTKPYWEFTVNGYPTMEKDATQTLTVTIDGVTDYSKLTFGTYSESVITATTVVGQANQFTITGVGLGTSLFWVKMPADDTHNLTRLDYEITVTNPTPEFSISINGSDPVQKGLTMTVGSTIYTSDFKVTVTKGDANQFTFISDNPDVVKFNLGGNPFYGHDMVAVSEGTANITVKHNSNNLWNEQSVTFKVSVNSASTPGSGETTPEDSAPEGYQALTLPTAGTYGNNQSAMKFEASAIDAICSTGDVELLIVYKSTEYNGAPSVAYYSTDTYNHLESYKAATKDDDQKSATVIISSEDRSKFENGYYLLFTQGGSFDNFKAVYVKKLGSAE